MGLNHQNHEYSGGYPLNAGDRYWSQDLGRDFWFLMDQIGKAVQGATGKIVPTLMYGGVATKGADWTHVDITAGLAYVPLTVIIPNSFASIPPTTTTATVSAVPVAIPVTTALDIAALGATLNGVATNYLKVQYAETNGSTRNRYKGAGSYAYERVQSCTITCDTTAPTANQIALCTIVGNGSSTMTITATRYDSMSVLAPKPQTGAGNIGIMTAIDVASAGTLTMPAGNGTYQWVVMTYGATVNSVKTGQTAAGASPGGTASANCTVLVWRIA
jgi:hypothetical protein